MTSEKVGYFGVKRLIADLPEDQRDFWLKTIKACVEGIKNDRGEFAKRWQVPIKLDT